MEESFKDSLSEVYLVIQNSDIDIIKKIPDNFLNFIKDNMNKDNIKTNTQNINLKNIISEDEKTILSLIYRDYLVSDEERNALLNEEQIKRIKYEQLLREKYNPDNLFKNSKVKTQNLENTTITEQTSIIEYKEKNFIQKMFDKIINLFKGK